MPMLDSGSIRKLSQLAKLGLSEKEIEMFTGQLDEILTFFEKLQKVDTQGVEPIAQITGLTDISREDSPQTENLAAKLLECSPRGIRKNHIRVPKVI